jgi:preprotein translocase subunit Sec63
MNEAKRLTDEEAKATFDETGNPDGTQSTTFPKILVLPHFLVFSIDLNSQNLTQKTL